jgi:hypothetical protein
MSSADRKGGVKALPLVRFNLNYMNTVNESTGFTPFHLRFGRSMRVIPTIASSPSDTPADVDARALILTLKTCVLEVQDNLLLAKMQWLWL